MSDAALFEHIRPWVERQLGFPLETETAHGGPKVGPADPDSRPLFGVKSDAGVAFTARPDWIAGVQAIVDDLHIDLLFSIVGSYELSRVTLPDEYAV